MTAHKHAALMALYAQDAAETETPWDRWQALDSGGRWSDAMKEVPFSAFYEYRRKPQMVTRTITYPEPCREAPHLKSSTMYYLADPDGVIELKWTDTQCERNWLAQGRIHLNRENADAHRVALLGGG